MREDGKNPGAQVIESLGASLGKSRQVESDRKNPEARAMESRQVWASQRKCVIPVVALVWASAQPNVPFAQSLFGMLNVIRLNIVICDLSCLNYLQHCYLAS